MQLFNFLLAAVLAVSGIRPVQAQDKTIKICVDDIAHAPYSFPDRDGFAQSEVRSFFARAGWAVSYVARPLVRCRADAKAGSIDAFLGLAYVPNNTALFSFPEIHGRPDTRKAIGRWRARLVKRSGSMVRWDGTYVTQITRPVLLATGVASMRNWARSMSLPFDDGARSPTRNLEKLIRFRGDAAILWEHDGAAALADEQFAGKVVFEGPPVFELPLYLAFSHQFYARENDISLRIWSDFSKLGIENRIQNQVRTGNW